MGCTEENKLNKEHGGGYVITVITDNTSFVVNKKSTTISLALVEEVASIIIFSGAFLEMINNSIFIEKNPC